MASGKQEISIFWFRRDLRLEDNTALENALSAKLPVLGIFIFDPYILRNFTNDDPRVNFIYSQLEEIDKYLKSQHSSLLVLKQDVKSAWEKLISEFNIKNIYFNKDYEPDSLRRDDKTSDLLKSNNIDVYTFKDQVIFEEYDILKKDGKPYTVYTPYKNKWLELYRNHRPGKIITKRHNFVKNKIDFPSKEQLQIVESSIKVKPFTLRSLSRYNELRDIPSQDSGSYLGPHLRFGTISIRRVVKIAQEKNATFLSELIWREFFMQILYHYPQATTSNFKSKYDRINWRNDENDFRKWCEGKTGFPLVDAGMRQLNKTGYMHNRVRMITASFLVKHLLVHWQWGEEYFRKKLLDYELSSNNGNWQWVAGTGCDAAPYFRIFNPITQQKKFDPDLVYVKKWIPEFGTKDYPQEMIDHGYARNRCLKAYSLV